MFITSAECRNVMIVRLMVMSCMNPHMIGETWVGMVDLVGYLVSLIV
jgi:hypothetical protein